MIEYRELRTGHATLKLSAIGFGVWTVGTPWWGIHNRTEGIALLRHAYERGVTFFDTADTYASGAAETVVAEALGDVRDRIIIATKFGYDIYINAERSNQQERPHNWSPRYMRFALEQSLKRLKTDYIDYYQLHNPRLDAIVRDDLFEELERARAEGLIRAYGVALGPALELRQIDEGLAAVERGLPPQIIYNPLERQLGEGIFPLARAKAISTLVRVPHASGLLDGTAQRRTEFPEGDHRRWRINTPEKRQLWEAGLARAEALSFLASGRTLGQAALQFVLREPSVASVLPNIYSQAALDEFIDACATPPITDEEYERIRAIVGSADPATTAGGLR